MSFDFDTILRSAREAGASDVLFAPGEPATARVRGQLQALPGAAPSPAILRDLALRLRPDHLDGEEGERWAHTDSDGARYRLSPYQAEGGVHLAVRLVPRELPPLKSLDPELLEAVLEPSPGLILVVGPAGSGRSTTAAGLLQRLNAHHACHVVTVEDPVEFVFTPDRARFSQREIGRDVPSQLEGILSAGAVDGDVLFVDELTTALELQAALQTIDNGLLVIATVAGGDFCEALEALLRGVEPEPRQDLLNQIAIKLRLCLAQRLLVGTRESLPVYEVLVPVEEARLRVVKGELHALGEMLEAGARFGSRSLDQALAVAVCAGQASPDEAAAEARDPTLLEGYVRRLLGEA